MNPMAIVQTLMGNMKLKMPQNYKIANELMQNRANPQELAQQMMSNMPQERKQGLLNQMQQYGCPEKILSQLQNMK